MFLLCSVFAIYLNSDPDTTYSQGTRSIRDLPVRCPAGAGWWGARSAALRQSSGGGGLAGGQGEGRREGDEGAGRLQHSTKMRSS